METLPEGPTSAQQVAMTAARVRDLQLRQPKSGTACATR